jgi:hypothetical protein
MKKLVENYEKRIKNFVIKLAEKPIIIKKQKDKYLTSREEYYANNSNKIIDKKGFSFKFYKTEKERIEEYIKEKKKIDDYFTKNAATKKRKSPEVRLIQPSMRFKARTDLERVYDVLNSRESLYQDKKIVKNQLNKLGFISRNVGDLEDDDIDEEEEENNKKHKINIQLNNDEKNNINLTEEDKKKKTLHNKIIQDRRNMVERRKIFLTLGNNKKNSDKNEPRMQHLREELHQKVHFKAMENLTMFKTSTMNHNLFKVWSKEDIDCQKNLAFNKNIYYACLANGFNKPIQTAKSINSYNSKGNKLLKEDNKNLNNSIEKENDNYTNYKSYTNRENSGSSIINNKKLFNKCKSDNIFSSKRILEDAELTKQIVNTNPLLFNYNFNVDKTSNKKNIIPNKKLDILKQLAFTTSNDEDSEIIDNMKNDNFEDLKKEENIIIDGKQYKKSETYKIADKILKKCNWNKNKVKYNSNFGKGKLMFTNGMTLKEFQEKYGILP